MLVEPHLASCILIIILELTILQVRSCAIYRHSHWN